jgi:uncharacterized protein (TIGR02266 family)
MPSLPLDSSKICRNLYSFIRLRLGRKVSDREIARLWDMEWKCFNLLKHGNRQMPRVQELEALAKLLAVDPAFVFEVARGVSAKKVHQLLLENDPEKLARLLMAGIHGAHAKAELKETDFRAILDRVTDAVFTADLRGGFREVNHRLCELTGYEQVDILQRSLFDVFFPGDPARLMEVLGPIYKDGAAHGVELLAGCRDGRQLILELSATRIDDQKGVAVGIQGVARDATERRRVEAELRTSQAKLASLTTNIPDIVMQVDGGARILYINSTVDGATVENTLGRSLYDYVPADQHEMLKQVFGRVSQTGAPETFRCSGGALENKLRWYETHVGPIKNGDGEIESLVLISRDITEQRLLEERLAREHATLKTTFDAVPAVCMLIDKDGTVRLANRFLYDVTNRTEQEIIGRQPSEVLPVAVDPEACPVRRSFVTGKFEQRISKVTDMNGAVRYVHVTARPVVGSGGNVEQVVQIAVDVTDQMCRGDSNMSKLWSVEGLPEVATHFADREKRQLMRVPVEAAVHCETSERSMTATARNLSRGGVCVQTDVVLPVGTEINLSWMLPEQDVAITAKAVIAWAHAAAPGTRTPTMGLKFVELSAEQQDAIADFVIGSAKRCA